MGDRYKEQENTESEDVNIEVKIALKERDYTYELPLGKGSYCRQVVQVKHPVDQLKYAIKILPIDDHGESAKYQKRELEVLTKSDLWRHNIVKYYNCWKTKVGGDPYLFIKMELCGLNLEAFVYNNEMGGAEIIRRREPPRFYQHVSPQIFNGLKAMHSLGLVHRDIHPSNILVANPVAKPSEISQVTIKIADFGLAREIASVIDASPSLTDTPKLQKLSAGIGNELFRAPELATEHYDYKVDLFSAGIVLYFLSRYLEDKNQWRSEILALREGERGKDNMCHDDDETLFRLFSLLLKEDPNERPSADEALEIALTWKNFESDRPGNLAVTDGKIKEKKFLVRVSGKEALNRRLTKDDTLLSLQEEIKKCTGIEAESQVLKQETIINDKEEIIEINSDLDVRCMFQSAEKAGKNVVIVVSDCTAEMEVDHTAPEMLS